MLVTAVAMLRGGAQTTAPQPRAGRSALGRSAWLGVQGLLVGVVTGLVGAGGGFLVVPALVLLGGLPMSAAVGTSLVVVAMNALAGFAGHLGTTPIDARLAALVTGAAVVGSLLGSRFAGRIAPDTLRRGFGVFVIAMAVFILGQQIPETLGVARGIMLPWAAAAALLAFAVGLAANAVRRARLPAPRPTP